MWIQIADPPERPVGTPLFLTDAQQPTQGLPYQSPPIVTGAPFFLPIAVPFTGVDNERFTVYSSEARTVGDLEIIGGIMDLESVQGQVTIDGRPVWASGNVPLCMYFGRPDGPDPIIFHHPPTPLSQRQRIRFDLVNVESEQAGTLVLVCRQLDTIAPIAQILEGYEAIGLPDVIAIDSLFAGPPIVAVDAIAKKNTSPIIEDDFIWTHLHTTLQNPSVRISGIDNKAWMDDFVPLWALAGRAGSVIPKQEMTPPIFIPAGYAVGFEFRNDGFPIHVTGEVSGKVFLGGRRTAKRALGQ